MYWIKDSNELWLNSRGARTDVWALLPNGEAWGFLSFYMRDGKWILGEIELQAAYQGFGMSRELVKTVEEFLEDTLWTIGDFTPEGQAALQFMPLVPGYSSSLKTKSMTFVKSWERWEAIY